MHISEVRLHACMPWLPRSSLLGPRKPMLPSLRSIDICIYISWGTQSQRDNSYWMQMPASSLWGHCYPTSGTKCSVCSDSQNSRKCLRKHFNIISFYDNETQLYVCSYLSAGPLLCCAVVVVIRARSGILCVFYAQASPLYTFHTLEREEGTCISADPLLCVLFPSGRGQDPRYTV